MEATEDSGQHASAEGNAGPGIPLEAPPPEEPAAEGKPSTRGWTMIMDEPEDEATPAIPAPGVAPTVVPTSPSTRGWTMLDELDEPPTPSVAAVEAPKPPKASGSKIPGKPSSRGWTMFMEAELEAAQSSPDEPSHDEELDFYEGPVYTESGTVVSMMPTADNPNVSGGPPRPPRPLAAEAEPLTSFASRLHGDDRLPPPEPRGIPIPRPEPEEPEIPSFTGGLGAAPVEPEEEEEAAASSRSAVSGPGTDAPVTYEETGGMSNMLIIVGLLVIVAVAIYFAVAG